MAGWAARDPIERTRSHLERIGRWDDALDAEARKTAAELRTALRDAVYDAPDIDPLEVFDHVFAVSTPALLQQRDELATELCTRDLTWSR